MFCSRTDAPNINNAVYTEHLGKVHGCFIGWLEFLCIMDTTMYKVDCASVVVVKAWNLGGILSFCVLYAENSRKCRGYLIEGGEGSPGFWFLWMFFHEQGSISRDDKMIR